MHKLEYLPHIAATKSFAQLQYAEYFPKFKANTLKIGKIPMALKNHAPKYLNLRGITLPK